MAVPRHEYPTLTALRQDASHQARRQAGRTGQMPHQRPHGTATPHLIAARYLQALDQPATFITQKVLPEPGQQGTSDAAWPDGVPVQVHGMDADPIVVGKGAIDAARELIGQAKDAELFLYSVTRTISPTARFRRTPRMPLHY
jgi:hypothetical protein